MRCNHCNSEVEDGTNFCPYCGSQIVISQQASQPQQRQQSQHGQYQQPQQAQYQQPYQGQYQQPQQGQYQQPYQGQYQQPQQGQYQQPYQGQYQQPQQGQYQQSQQGQYQQPYQGQYQQRFVQQKSQLPHRPQLTFMEAINLASNRLTEFEGRSRRSEFWWWYLAVSIGTCILYFIPYLGALSPLIMFGLVYSVAVRRMNDVPAPEWFGKTFLGIWGVNSLLMLIYTLGRGYYRIELFDGLVDIIGSSSFENMMSGFAILMFIGSIAFIYFGIKDSNPEIDPLHGPSPKYTL